jgi:hypothetical protein
LYGILLKNKPDGKILLLYKYAHRVENYNTLLNCYVKARIISHTHREATCSIFFIPYLLFYIRRIRVQSSIMADDDDSSRTLSEDDMDDDEEDNDDVSPEDEEDLMTTMEKFPKKPLLIATKKKTVIKSGKPTVVKKRKRRKQKPKGTFIQCMT